MNPKGLFNNDNERRGVAPIIATLLMVAIAVVGGILIFVFAQGFFSGTSDIASANNDALQVTGYDARDITTLRYVNGTVSVAINSASDGLLDGTTTDNDSIMLYVRNSGTKQVSITSIEFNENSHSTYSSSALTTTVPAAGSFTIVDSNSVESDSTVEGGELVTIIVRYSGDDLANGRNTAAKIFTANGGEFTIPVKIGSRET